LTELNPSSLATIQTRNKPASIFDPSEYLKAIVVANDGRAVVVSGYGSGSGSTKPYLYSMVTSTFSTPSSAGTNPSKFFYFPVVGGSDNGATVPIVESGLSPAQPVFRYTPSSGVLGPTTFNLMHSNPDVHE